MSVDDKAPVPARLIFLSDLYGRAVGGKVRFLGCVSDYSIQTGTLVLKHNFPTSAPRSVTAHVNIELVSSSLKPTDTQIGEWVNVIGHITDAPPRRQGTRRTRSLGTGNVVNVQAVVLWSAGSVKLGDYERILGERREVERRADK